MEQINLEDITSIETLESMAYRQVLALEQAKQNLAIIQQRIAQVEAMPKEEEKGA
jgi:hypothetical protein